MLALLLAVQIGIPVRTMPMPRTTDAPSVAIASNGSSVLAAWIENDTIAVARLYPWLSAEVSSVHKFETHASHPQIVTDGDSYLVAWSESIAGKTDIHLARFDLLGGLVEGPAVACAGCNEPATLLRTGVVTDSRNVAACGNDILAATDDVVVSSNFGRGPSGPFYFYDIHARWVSSGGSASTGAMTPSQTTPLPTMVPPVYACTAERCSVIAPAYDATTRNLNLFVATIPCSSGTFTSVRPIAAPARMYAPSEHPFAAAANGDRVLVVYETTTSLTPALAGTMLHLDSGTQDLEFIIALGAASHPVVAAAQDGFLVAYDVAEDDTTKHIEAVRVGPQPAAPRHRGAR